MKILVFAPQIHLLAGAEKLSVELAEGLNSQPGIRADLLVMGSEGLSGTEKTKQRLLSEGVQSVRFLGRKPNTRGRNILRFILKLRHILQMGHYDYVETSQIGPTILACWATLGLRTQHIAGIHEIYLKDHQKSWSYKFLRFSILFNKNVRFYAVSKQAMQHWIEYARINPERIRVIYNSIAGDHFTSTQNELTLKDFQNIDGCRVLFIGRLCKRKGLDILIDALGPILWDENIHLFIVGWHSQPDSFYKGDENLVERISKQIAENAWTSRIHFLGRRDDMPLIMDCSDMLIHPARDEGFGLVLAEALAAGLPIVATNVGGIPEVLFDTDSVLVPPDDPVAVRQAVLEILRRTPQESAHCRKRARQRAEYFRPERRITDMLEMFQELSHNL